MKTRKKWGVGGCDFWGITLIKYSNYFYLLLLKSQETTRKLDP